MMLRVVRRTATCSVCCAALLAVVAQAGAATAAGSGRRLVLYSVADAKQFVNNADDRERGKGDNPFGNYSNPFKAPPDQERGYGPFPGDEALVSYKLYSDPSLKHAVGTAVLTCEYDFSQLGTCNETFRLGQGSLVTTGSFPFDATRFSMSISGGDRSYGGYEGHVSVSAPASGQPRPRHVVIPISCPCRLLARQRLVFDLRPPAHALPVASPSLTVYAVTRHEQFINNDDDEGRGDVNNPFVTHDRSTVNNKGNTSGPFAGDIAVYSFDLYSDASLKSKIGTEDLVCLYNFHRNAFCNANFQLQKGTLVGAGKIAFDANRFSLAVTGGAGAYIDNNGDVEARPSTKDAQRLTFFLAGT